MNKKILKIGLIILLFIILFAIISLIILFRNELRTLTSLKEFTGVVSNMFQRMVFLLIY